MRNDKLVPGVILVMLGAAFLLHNYGLISFHWSNFFYLWPIFIVIAGVNLLFAHNKSPLATIIKLAVVIAGFGLVLFGNFNNRNYFWPHINYQSDDDSDEGRHGKDIVKIEGNSYFNETYSPDAHLARLNISGGGTTYNLSDTTNQLFTASTKEFYGKYDFNHSVQDSVYVLDFKMRNNHGNNLGWNNEKSNSATFKLNVNPEWDINVKTGATKLDFDLSKFKVRTLDISGGAASFDVKLGQPLNASNIKISTGVSEVNISVPATAACRIKANSGLSSTDFEGFTKKADDSYETPGFATAKNKFYIKIDGGVSDFKVKRY